MTEKLDVKTGKFHFLKLY